MAKVSFVLPAYKRAFLKQAIESILAQTYRDFELIIVDDCSPENLKEVVDEFQDERIAYHRNEKNIGGKDLIAAWNKAMEYATGEWCVLASDDDEYFPEYLEEMIRLTEKYPQVDLVHCRNCEIDATGKVTSIGGSRAEYESGVQMLYSSSVLRVHQRMADLMFRRKAYLSMGGFLNYPVGWYADNDTAIRLSWKNGAACSDKILFKFRNSGMNLSSAGIEVARKVEAGLIFLDRIRDLISERQGMQLNREDRLTLSLCMEGVEMDVYGLIRAELFSLSYIPFCRVIKESNLPHEKAQCFVKERIVSWLNLRRYLPRWRGYRF